MRAKNPFHARSHDPGGSDPVMFAWEDVGAGAGGSSGIQFDTEPQAGGWLFVETTDDTGSPNSFGMEFLETSGGGVSINTGSLFFGDVDELTNGARFQLTGSGVRLDLTGSQTFDVCADYNGTRMFKAENVAGTGRLGFFGVTTVVRPATPVTLGDVITALQSLGLVT